MVSHMKILDTVGVRVGDNIVYLAVEYDLLTKGYKIIGVEEYPENPIVTREPLYEEERIAIEFLEKILEEDPEKIHELYGKIIEIEGLISF